MYFSKSGCPVELSDNLCSALYVSLLATFELPTFLGFAFKEQISRPIFYVFIILFYSKKYFSIADNINSQSKVNIHIEKFVYLVNLADHS